MRTSLSVGPLDLSLLHLLRVNSLKGKTKKKKKIWIEKEMGPHLFHVKFGFPKYQSCMWTTCKNLEDDLLYNHVVSFPLYYGSNTSLWKKTFTSTFYPVSNSDLYQRYPDLL